MDFPTAPLRPLHVLLLTCLEWQSTSAFLSAMLPLWRIQLCDILGLRFKALSSASLLNVIGRHQKYTAINKAKANYHRAGFSQQKVTFWRARLFSEIMGGDHFWLRFVKGVSRKGVRFWWLRILGLNRTVGWISWATLHPVDYVLVIIQKKGGYWGSEKDRSVCHQTYRCSFL